MFARSIGSEYYVIPISVLIAADPENPCNHTPPYRCFGTFERSSIWAFNPVHGGKQLSKYLPFMDLVNFGPGFPDPETIKTLKELFTVGQLWKRFLAVVLDCLFQTGKDFRAQRSFAHAKSNRMLIGTSAAPLFSR